MGDIKIYTKQGIPAIRTRQGEKSLVFVEISKQGTLFLRVFYILDASILCPYLENQKIAVPEKEGFKMAKSILYKKEGGERCHWSGRYALSIGIAFHKELIKDKEQEKLLNEKNGDNSELLKQLNKDIADLKFSLQKQQTSLNSIHYPGRRCDIAITHAWDYLSFGVKGMLGNWRHPKEGFCSGIKKRPYAKTQEKVEKILKKAHRHVVDKNGNVLTPNGTTAQKASTAESGNPIELPQTAMIQTGEGIPAVR